jgi:antitoxin component YwqK of YwqJK toxin-antitoxin module
MDGQFFTTYSPSELYGFFGSGAEYVSYEDQNMAHLDVPRLFPSETIFRLKAFSDICREHHSEETPSTDHEEVWVSGVRRARGGFRAGRPFGTWRFFHENGHCAEVVCLDAEGNIFSEHVLFYDNGERQFAFYHQGQDLTGVLKEGYPNGQIKSEINIHNGKREGMCRQWHENGRLSFEGIFKDGQPGGQATNWDANGGMICERIQVENTEVFHEKEYTDKGQLKRVRSYLTAKGMHGEETVYYDYERRIMRATPEVNYYLYNKLVSKVEFFARTGALA